MYQRNPDGTTNPPSDYPPIPDAVQFFTGWRYEVPVEVHYWGWRTDFNSWGALVTFADGTRIFTNPEDKPMPRGMRECFAEARAILEGRGVVYACNAVHRTRRAEVEDCVKYIMSALEGHRTLGSWLVAKKVLQDRHDCIEGQHAHRLAWLDRLSKGIW